MGIRFVTGLPGDLQKNMEMCHELEMECGNRNIIINYTSKAKRQNGRFLRLFMMEIRFRGTLGQRNLIFA